MDTPFQLSRCRERPQYNRPILFRHGREHGRSSKNRLSMSQRKSDLGIPLPYTWLNQSTRPNHPDFALSLGNLANLYGRQGRYNDAEALYKRSLAIEENSLGRDHFVVAILLRNLANGYLRQARYADAEPLYQQSLAILEKLLGPAHPDVAPALNSLATLYLADRRYIDAL
jgi:tetratricopeptide (TPR) repeat protein